MTEAEWLERGDPGPMLAWLGDKVSERKLRLFAVACCRDAWGAPLAEGETVHHALRVGRRLLTACERHADGAVSDQELAASRAEAEAARRSPLPGEGPFDLELRWASRAAGPPAELLALPAGLRAEYADWWGGMFTFYGGTGEEWQQYHDQGLEAISLRQCQLLRDVFDNPFRPGALNRAWLSWEGGTVTKLAAAVYEERVFDRLPVLVDALEEAGCAEAELLTHLRGPGPHVRGCWALDLLLGKA